MVSVIPLDSMVGIGNIENFNPIESVEIYNSIGQIIEIFYGQKNKHQKT